MKLLLFSFLFISNLHAQIIYLDLNNNPYEKKAAIEAANKSGKQIIVYPKGSELFDKEKAFEILKEHPPESLFISGHDGGGSFSGDRNESFGKYEIDELVKENPEIANKLRVLGLIGCNTANHSQITHWKQTFPNLSFVAGYDGSAPSGTRPAGWRYIKDTILKTDTILKETDKNKIKRIFENFGYINYLAATLYIDTNKCSEEDPEKQYIYRPLRKSNEKFKTFDTSECLEKRNTYETKFSSSYNQFLSGETPIPTDTSKGVLRELYSFLRQNEHCFMDYYEDGNYPTGDHLLYLLFYNDVFKSFSKYYGSELIDFFKNLSVFSDPKKYKISIENQLRKKEKNLQRLNTYVNDYNLFEKDFSIYLSQEEQEYKTKYAPKYLTKYNDLVKRFQTGQPYQAQLDNLEKDPGWRTFQIMKSKIEDLKKELKQGKKSEIYTQIINEKSYLEDQVKYLEENLLADFKDDYNLTTYKNLAAKTPEEFKNLNRKQVNQFINDLNGLSLELTEKSDFNDEFKYAAEQILHRLNSDVIPFNWHDSNLGNPIAPKEYTKDELAKEKTRVRTFESMYFSNRWD